MTQDPKRLYAARLPTAWNGQGAVCALAREISPELARLVDYAQPALWRLASMQDDELSEQ